MPLPTTNLTWHCDPSDTDKLFTTWVSGGPNTGTPSDGSAVQVWEQETDSSTDTTREFTYSTTGREPIYRSTTPLMLLPCLDFDGTDDQMNAQDFVGSDAQASEFLGASAKTILVAFYGESITAANALSYDNHALFCDGLAGFLGIFLKNNGGQRQAIAYNWDGNEDQVAININEAQSHVVVYRHDGTNLFISVDGGSELFVPSGATTTMTGNMRIGFGLGTGTRYNGRIGEIAVYNAALTGSNLTDAVSYFTSKWLVTADVTMTANQSSYTNTGTGGRFDMDIVT